MREKFSRLGAVYAVLNGIHLYNNFLIGEDRGETTILIDLMPELKFSLSTLISLLWLFHCQEPTLSNVYFIRW